MCWEQGHLSSWHMIVNILYMKIFIVLNDAYIKFDVILAVKFKRRYYYTKSLKNFNELDKKRAGNYEIVIKPPFYHDKIGKGGNMLGSYKGVM